MLPEGVETQVPEFNTNSKKTDEITSLVCHKEPKKNYGIKSKNTEFDKQYKSAQKQTICMNMKWLEKLNMSSETEEISS